MDKSTNKIIVYNELEKTLKLYREIIGYKLIDANVVVNEHLGNTLILCLSLEEQNLLDLYIPQTNMLKINQNTEPIEIVSRNRDIIIANLKKSIPSSHNEFICFNEEKIIIN